MDKKIKSGLALIGGLLVLAYVTAYYAGVFGPRSYADCLLQNSGGDRFIVINGCREMFPEDFSDLENPFKDIDVDEFLDSDEPIENFIN